MISTIKIFIKFLLSFLKKEWNINDYPLRYRKQNNADENSRWHVQIINWWVISGLGNTKQAAKKDLGKNYEAAIKGKGYKPRPGTEVPLEFASAESVDDNYELLEDFIEKILGFKKDSPVFISDLSSLYDFSMSDPVEKYFQRIEDVYKLDLRHIEDGNIARIMEAIKKGI